MKNLLNFSLDSFLSSGTIVSLGSQELILGWGKKVLSEKPEKFPSFYFNDFFLEKREPFFHYQYQLQIDSQILLSYLPSFKESLSLNWSLPVWDLFESACSNVKGEEIQKIVPYAQKRAFLEMTPSRLLGRLRSALEYLHTHPKTALYGCWNEGKGVLGVTPEILFRMELGKPIETMACAGTLKEGENWQNNHKLLKEHQLVIEGIKADLSELGTLQVGRTDLRTFSSLAHLVTPLQFYPKGALSLSPLIEKLHPTPALGGFPKEQSLQQLRLYAEKFPREGFGAPFGILQEDGRCVFYVAIRNMEWTFQEIILRAGCGITAESVLEDEKKEAENKFSAIKGILGL